MGEFELPSGDIAVYVDGNHAVCSYSCKGLYRPIGHNCGECQFFDKALPQQHNGPDLDYFRCKPCMSLGPKSARGGKARSNTKVSKLTKVIIYQGENSDKAELKVTITYDAEGGLVNIECLPFPKIPMSLQRFEQLLDLMLEVKKELDSTNV
jgi:hypothetical protein